MVDVVREAWAKSRHAMEGTWLKQGHTRASNSLSNCGSVLARYSNSGGVPLDSGARSITGGTFRGPGISGRVLPGEAD
jgi:hypothetical protein